MPTLKPRLALTLEPDQYAVLGRLAALQGRSKAALVADLLHDVIPVFERVADGIESARSMQAEAAAQVAADLDAARAVIEPWAVASWESFNLAVSGIGKARELQSAAGAQSGAARAARAAAKVPPSSNTGGTEPLNNNLHPPKCPDTSPLFPDLGGDGHAV